MAKQVNLSFKENDIELELYEWVKSKLNPGTYIKELLYNDYLIEKKGIIVPKVEVKKEVETLGETPTEGDYDFE